MRIAEIFRSLQGEGRLTGTPSVFVRTSGCNLRCRFCDTPYASWAPEGENLSVDEIVARVEELAGAARGSAAWARHVVLTGGEPMLCGRAGSALPRPCAAGVCTSRSKRPARATCPSSAT